MTIREASRSTRLGYVPALDGVRAIAILLVLSFHYFGIEGGATGLDVFFVLSGFLITTLLLDEHEGKGRIELRAFYVRRVRRLAPALAVLVAAYLVVTAAAGENRLGAALVAVSYASNFVMASGSALLERAHLVLLWSLAEEEQFYLVWPWLLLALIRSRRALYWVLGGYVLLSAWRAGLTLHGAPTYRIYNGPDMRATSLIAGSAFAIYRQRYGARVGEWAGQAGVCILLFGALLGWTVRVWAVFGEPILEAGVMLLIAAAVSETSLARGLAIRPLVWVGQRSYSLYLWHSLTLAGLVYLLGRGVTATTLGLAGSFAAAALSYRFVEQPFRRRRPKATVAPATEPAY